MAKQTINLGSGPDSYTGDSLNVAFTKINENFTDLYSGNAAGNIRASGNIIANTSLRTDGFIRGQSLEIIANAVVLGTISANNFTYSNGVALGDLSNSNINTSGNISGNNLTANNLYADTGDFVDLLVSGNLTVNGNTTFVDVTRTTIEDPLIEIGGNAAGAALTSNDTKDRGLILHYYNGAARDAFIGWDNSSSEIRLASNAIVVNDEVLLYDTYANVRAGHFIGNGSLLTGITSYANSNVVAYAQTGWAGDIIPNANATYSLGNVTNQWANLWVANNTIYLGGVPLGVTADNTFTVNGQPVLSNNSSTSIATTGDVSANVIDAVSLVGTSASLGDLRIQGATIYKEGGVDDRITITPDIEGLAYLQLPDDANASIVDTRLHNDVGNVEIASNGNNWLFNNSGNLVIPGNINYSNGVSILNGVSFGNILVGNSAINFSPNTSGDGYGFSTIELRPDINAYDDSYLIIDPTYPSHIHIRAGGTQDNSLTQLFLGGENSHFRVDSGPNPPVYIAANNNVWTFDTEGNLNIPGTIVFTSSPAVLTLGTLTTIDVNASGNISANYFLGNGSQLTGLPQSYTDANVTNLMSNLGSNNLSTTGNISAGNISVTGNISGNIVAPGSNTRIIFNDNGLLGSSGAFTFDKSGNTLTIGTTAGTLKVADIQTPQAGVSLRLIPSSGTTLSYGHLNPLFTNTYDLGQSSARWQNLFANVGNINSLTVSGNITSGNILTNNLYYANGVAYSFGTSYSDSNVISLLSNLGSNSFTTTGNITGGNLTATGNITAGNLTGNSANVTLIAGSYSWSFTNTGNLVLPGNTFAVNYANGTVVSLGAGGAGNYGDSNVVSLLSSFGTNTVSTSGNITGGNLLSTAGANIILGNATSYLKQTASNAYISLADSVKLFPDTNASALNGVLIGGSGYILGPNGSRVLTLNYNSVGGALGVQTNLVVGTTASGGTANITGNSTTGVNTVLAGVTNTIFSNTIAAFSSNVNNYTQITFQNKNTGNDATADFILTADNGNDSTNYGDFGIINSGYDNATPTNSLGNIVYAADTYIYAQGNTANTSQSGGNLVIGTTTVGKTVKIFAGGATSNNLVANISSTGVAVTGNVSASYFQGNGSALTGITANIVGNIVGTSPNVTLIAGNYSWTFDNLGNASFANGVVVITGNNTTGVSALDVGVTADFLTNTIASFTANVNGYTQVTLQNKNTGADATADYIITADNGSDTTNYIDLGIINSGYDNTTPTNSLGNLVFAADGYLYTQGNSSNASQPGGNLTIGTTVPGKNVKIFAGGANISSIIANIGNTGVAVTGTLSSTGTATVGNLNTAGLVSATGNITGGNLISNAGVSTTTLTATGNIVGGNLNTTGLISATGNITGGNLISNGGITATTLTATGNITGGNLLTSGKFITTNGGDLILNSASGAAEGAQIVLAWKSITGITGQSNATWNMDVDGSNSYRIFYQNSTGTTGVPITAYSANSDVALGANVTVATNLTVSGNITGNTNGFAIGYRDIPQVALSANATITTSDAGKHYYSTSASNLTLTIANNASQAFQVGAAINIINTGTGNITIAQGSGVTLYFAGNSTASNRTLASFGAATIQKVATDTWFLVGVGIT